MDARERTYTYEDPTALVATGLQRSGFEYLAAIRDGELPHPPICATIGFRFLEVETGRVVMELEPGEHQYNPVGSIHGGIAATLLDSVAGSAVHTTLPAGVGYTTISLNTTYLRPMLADSGAMRAEGTLVKAGRRIALAQAHLTDGEGRLVAHATSTCMVLEP